jgi:hypothetical protein
MRSENYNAEEIEYIKTHFATGVRTKKYNCFKEGECISIQSVFIRNNNLGKRVFVEDKSSCTGMKQLTPDEIETLSWNDGFNFCDDFWEFFPEDFNGKIIHWTNFKY